MVDEQSLRYSLISPPLRLLYLCLSPTFGMHQYTADLANRMAAAGHDVHVIGPTALPRDRYAPAVRLHTPLANRTTGFSREGVQLADFRRLQGALHALLPSVDSPLPLSPSAPVLAHFTSPHLWNPLLIQALRRRGAAVIHTLHDLEPHTGVRFGRLIPLWNHLIIRSGAHLLVHAQRYVNTLAAAGAPLSLITCTPLLHGFLSAARPWPPAAASDSQAQRPPVVLFFGRVEVYKGLDVLLAAWPQVRAQIPAARLVVAGPWAPGLALPSLPPGGALYNRLVLDAEAEQLFRTCALLALPYRDATQSALIAAAFAYGLPVVATRTGALSEHISVGETGWITPPADPAALAAALIHALADPSRLRHMGAAARAWYDRQRQDEAERLRQLYASFAA